MKKFSDYLVSEAKGKIKPLDNKIISALAEKIGETTKSPRNYHKMYRVNKFKQVDYVSKGDIFSGLSMTIEWEVDIDMFGSGEVELGKATGKIGLTTSYNKDKAVTSCMMNIMFVDDLTRTFKIWNLIELD